MNAKRYVGERVAFGATTISTLSSLVSGRAGRYPPGSAVPVFYNPANPAEAVLERRVAGISLLWLVAGGCFFGAAMLVGFV